MSKQRDAVAASGGMASWGLGLGDGPAPLGLRAETPGAAELVSRTAEVGQLRQKQGLWVGSVSTGGCPRLPVQPAKGVARFIMWPPLVTLNRTFGVFVGVGEGVEAQDVEFADAAVLDEAAEGHAAAGRGADVEVGVEVDAGEGVAGLGAVRGTGMVGGDGSDEGEGQVVAAADSDGEEAVLQECGGGLGDAVVGFGEVLAGEDVAGVEDAGPLEAVWGGNAVASEGFAEGFGAVFGAGAAAVEADAFVIGHAEERDAAAYGRGVEVRGEARGGDIGGPGRPGWVWGDCGDHGGSGNRLAGRKPRRALVDHRYCLCHRWRWRGMPSALYFWIRELEVGQGVVEAFGGVVEGVVEVGVLHELADSALPLGEHLQGLGEVVGGTVGGAEGAGGLGGDRVEVVADAGDLLVHGSGGLGPGFGEAVGLVEEIVGLGDHGLGVLDQLLVGEELAGVSEGQVGTGDGAADVGLLAGLDVGEGAGLEHFIEALTKGVVGGGELVDVVGGRAEAAQGLFRWRQ